MKKQSILWMLALAFGAGMMLSSCKDNVYEGDKPLTPEEEATEKATEKGEALLSILNYTAGLDSLPDGWYQNGYTVEPTVGTIENEADPYVRYVSANSALSAYVTYKSMISGDVTGEAKDDSWSLDGIGKLKFTVSDQPDVYATVDVDVQQLPHLRQIRFVSPSALGENSNWFTGDPFYNFGDVVKDANGAYWICVRPADKTAKKSTTHWISFNMANNNFKECTKTGKGKLVLPDKLGDKTGSEEFIPDFVQFLNAISPGITDKIGATYEEVEISDVKRTVKALSKIAYFWKDKNILYNEKIIPAHVRAILLNTIYKKANLNVFYFGHHEGSTPDVHLLTIDGYYLVQNTKQEIKFEWPAAGDDYSFNSYATSGKINDNLKKLTIKTKNVTLPENAIVVRYKTGPQLSGSKTIWGNDEYPGKSFMGNTKYTIEDIHICNNNKLANYYTLGDIVNTKLYDYFYCVKPASSNYSNDKKNYAYFLAPGLTKDIANSFIDKDTKNWDNSKLGFTHEDIAIVMFNLLNANLQLGDVFTYSYKTSLNLLWKYLVHSSLSNGYKYTYFSDNDKKYFLNLSFMNTDNKMYKYTITYHKGKYTFEFKGTEAATENYTNDEFPPATLLFYHDQGDSSNLLNLKETSGADVNVSILEATDAYNKANMTMPN